MIFYIFWKIIRVFSNGILYHSTTSKTYYAFRLTYRMSPNIAHDAVTPPVVGLVRITMKGTFFSSIHLLLMLFLTFALKQ